MWATVPGDTTPPAPVFSFTPAPQVGSVPGSGIAVHVPFSTEADVTWTWSPATSTYLRSYSGVPDKLLDGSQTAASNVVVMTVPTSIGPWYENSEGGQEVQVNALGSGPVVVLRDGMAITGTWSRATLTQPATLTATDGTPIPPPRRPRSPRRRHRHAPRRRPPGAERTTAGDPTGPVGGGAGPVGT